MIRLRITSFVWLMGLLAACASPPISTPAAVSQPTQPAVASTPIVPTATPMPTPLPTQTLVPAELTGYKIAGVANWYNFETRTAHVALLITEIGGEGNGSFTDDVVRMYVNQSQRAFAERGELYFDGNIESGLTFEVRITNAENTQTFCTTEIQIGSTADGSIGEVVCPKATE